MGFSAEADLSQRLLKVSYSHVVGIEEARGCLEKVKSLMQGLQPGFRFLTDFTNLESMDASCSDYMTQMMDLCDEQGVAMVLRVASDQSKDIGFNIMSIFHYTRDVVIVNCNNWDEVEKALAD
jgi:anti-anti-sigma regulatory factor